MADFKTIFIDRTPVIISRCDAEKVKRRTWRIERHPRGYNLVHAYNVNMGKRGVISMQRYIMDAASDERVVIINGNDLDFRRENLVVVKKLKKV